MDDVSKLRDWLSEIEREAKKLNWNNERPWLASSHIWFEKGVPYVDLHDLNTRLARKAVKAVIRSAEQLETGAFGFVTGIGRHSMGEASIPKMTIGVLGDACAAKQWGCHPIGQGRLVCITDREKAPAAALGGMGRGMWFFVVGFCALLILVMFKNCWPG